MQELGALVLLTLGLTLVSMPEICEKEPFNECSTLTRESPRWTMLVHVD